MAKLENKKKKLSGIDLVNSIDTIGCAEDGEWMTVDDANGNPLPAKIKIAGVDSEKYKKQTRITKNKRAKRARKNPTSLFAGIDAEDEMDLAIALTVDWEWGEMTQPIAKAIDLPGEDLKCIPAIIKKVYIRFPLVLDQINTFAGDRANFIKS